MAKQQAPEKQSFLGNLKQIGVVFRFTAQRDRWFVPLIAVFTLTPLSGGIVATVLGAGILWTPTAIMLALLAAMIILNIRSRTAMMSQAEGQLGAAASIVQTIRGDWRVHPTIAATTQQDMVHLVISTRGVILLGEGNPSRVRQLIVKERRRLVKVIGNAELRDYVIGNGEGLLPLRKIQGTFLKLPPVIKKPEVAALDKRITALTSRPQMPQGAIPKNLRPPKLRGANRPR